MTPNPHDVARAKDEVAAARARLFGTLAQVQDRLKPSHLAQDAVESATQGIASAARKGADAARKRPFAVAAVAGAIGLVMARGWIGDIVTGGGDETSKADTSLKTKRVSRASKGS